MYSNSDLHSVSVTAVIHAIAFYIGQRYNVTLWYSDKHNDTCDNLFFDDSLFFYSDRRHQCAVQVMRWNHSELVHDDKHDI